MSFSSLPKFKDIRTSIYEHKSKRFKRKSVKDFTDIAIHHSLTKRGLAGSNAEAYARYHVDKLGWPGIGYHFVIEPDGTIKYCNTISLMCYHVGNHNGYAIGICLTGDFRYEKPTKEQEKALRALHAELKKQLPNYKRTRGHNEFPGYEWKQCPEFDYKAVLAGKDSGSPKWDGKSFPGRSAFQIGKSHPAVTLMGKRLVAHGFGSYYKVGPGPTFTEVDKKACAAFQRAQGWTGSDADGFPGPETWKRLMATAKGEKKPDPKPTPSKDIYRVKVDGKQVGAYKEDQNVVNAVQEGLKKNPDKIQIEKVK